MQNVIKGVLVLIPFLVIFSSCTKQTTCPAFHSAFIHDEDYFKQHYGLFLEATDSTEELQPRGEWDAKKTKFGIAEDIGYHKKWRRMYTIEKRYVFDKKDSTQEATSIGNLAQADTTGGIVDTTNLAQDNNQLATGGVVVDSSLIAADSVGQASDSLLAARQREEELGGPIVRSPDEPNFNWDQVVYMKYVGVEVIEKHKAAMQARAKAKKEAEKAPEPEEGPTEEATEEGGTTPEGEATEATEEDVTEEAETPVEEESQPTEVPVEEGEQQETAPPDDGF